MKWEESKRLLIEDLTGVHEEQKGVTISLRQKTFTPIELVNEIKNETDAGKEYIHMHINAYKHIERLKKKK